MSRVFLLSANVTTAPYPVYPLGMATVAAGLAARGHAVRQFDFLAAGRSEARLREALAAWAPDVVGLSLRNIDNTDSLKGEEGWYLGVARDLVRSVRAATAAPVVVGGPAFSLLPEEILAYLGADHGVVGEGERAFGDLVAALEEGRPAPRIVRGGAPLAGAEMPAPLLDPELVAFYVGRSGMVNLQTKRGCPHRCAYCTYPSLEGAAFRPRDPETVAEDVARLGREFGVDSFFFTDSVFNDAAGHYLEVAEALLRRGLKIRWCGLFRPAGIGRQEVALLKRSGLYAMELGTDATSDATLAALGKGFTFDEVVRTNRACVAEEVPCAHFVLFGGPGETERTVREGLENLAGLERCVVFAFSGIRILPGTGIHRRAVAEGVVAEADPLLKPVYYFSPEVDVEAMNAAVERAFARRRDRIFPPEEGQKRLEVMHRFGYRGLLWDELLSFGKPDGAPGRRRRA